jgi:hypothetical protein
MTRVHKPYVPDQWDKVLNIGPMSASLILKPRAALDAPKKRGNQESVLRIAQATEEDDLMQFCHELWEENGKEFFSFDAEKVRGHLRRSFEKRGGLFAVIGEPGKIEAGALLLIDPYYYSSDFALFELFAYVRPDFRASRHAKTLITWATKMADKLSLLLFIGILSSVRTAAKVRLYRRVLGDPSGAYFVYRPKSLMQSGNGSASH